MLYNFARYIFHFETLFLEISFEKQILLLGFDEEDLVFTLLKYHYLKTYFTADLGCNWDSFIFKIHCTRTRKKRKEFNVVCFLPLCEFVCTR